MVCYTYRQENLSKGSTLRWGNFFPLLGQIPVLCLLAAVVILLLTSAYSRADKVILSDGDVLEGVVTRQDRTSIVLEHGDLGRMVIPRSRIKTLTIDTPDVEVVLKDGDTIQGRLVKEDESGIILEHKDLGRMEISRDRIASSKVDVPYAKAELAGGDTIEGKLVERTDYAIVLEHPNLGRIEIPRERIDTLKIKEPEFVREEEEKGWFDSELRKLAGRTSRLKEKGWKASFDISLDSSTGNTDEQAARLGSHVERSLIDRRMITDMSYYHKVSEGDVTDNKFTLGYVRDWLYPESLWFWFLMGRFDYDEFESWEKRANAQIGGGYHLFNNDDMMLDLRLGLGPRREWGSENNDVVAEAILGADFRWDITSKQRCVFSPYFFPVVGDVEDYRARISGEWRFLFDKDMNLSFLIGTLYEYTSLVDPGKDHGDMRTYLGLRYAF